MIASTSSWRSTATLLAAYSSARSGATLPQNTMRADALSASMSARESDRPGAITGTMPAIFAMAIVAEAPVPEVPLSAARLGSSPRAAFPPARHILSRSSFVSPALSLPSTTPTQQGTQSLRQNACSHSWSAV